MQFSSAAKLALKKRVRLLLSSMCLCWISVFNCTYAFANSHAFENTIQTNNGNQTDILYTLYNSSLPLKEEVEKFYQLQNYSLIWSDGKKYNKNAIELYRYIQNLSSVGLDPTLYDVDVIQYFIESTIDDPIILIKSDVTFTHALIKLASHIDRGTLLGEDLIKDDDYSLIHLLNKAINNRTIISALQNLEPQHTNYAKLVTALKKYRSIEDEFDVITLHKKSLTIDDVSPQISKIRTRLHQFGDYTGVNLASYEFDESIAVAIAKYQSRHGLEADGILGKKTVKELNQPIAYRIQQIELNLERIRQLQNNNDERYVKVNIPEYKLYFIDNDKTIYQSRVVVGKKKNKTPVFSSELTELILSPYWHVPKSIASKEIIPLIQEDPEYLNRNNIKLLSNFYNQTQVISPDTVDWSNIDLTNSQLRFRQDPGVKNSLGRIKFIFPNNYNVYLHDTPSRSLFEQNQRAFSHGCIRLEDPFGLAEVLLSDQDTWSKNDLDALANRKKPKALKLDKPIPIHITYMTAWVDDQDVINFRPDIYKQDRKYASSLYNIAH